MKAKKVLWGLLLVGMAVFIVINQMGLLTADIGVWSIILGVVFVGALIEGIVSRSFFGIFFPIGCLWLIFDEPLGLPELSIWTVGLAVILLSIGCSLIFPASSKKRKDFEAEFFGTSGQTSGFSGENAGNQSGTDETNRDDVYCFNRFGSATKYVNTGNLTSAKLENHFGEMKVYFDGSRIQQEQVTIEVNNSFGELQIYLPKEWNVKNQISAALASAVEKNRGNQEGFPVVHLVGNVSFGEVVIFYV